MSIDFNQLNSYVSNCISNIIHNELSDIVDRIRERVEKNLDLVSKINLDALIEEAVENMCTTATCSTCNNDLDVESICAYADNLEIVVNNCRGCTGDYIRGQIQDNWAIMIKSRVDIVYDIHEVHVGDESIVITVNDYELAQDMPNEVFVVMIGGHLFRKFHTTTASAQQFIDTDYCQRLLTELGVEAQIVAITKEV